MALIRRNDFEDTDAVLQLRDGDRFMAYDPEPERSHFGAFLMGGMVVAGGLLALLYYDTGNLDARSNRDLAMGAFGRSETVDPIVPSLAPPGPRATTAP